MPTSTNIAPEFANDALELAMAQGLVRYRQDGSIGHLPFTLMPWDSPEGFFSESQRVCELYNVLYHRVARQLDFLEEHLAPIRKVDEFVAGLWSVMSESSIQRPWVYLSRHDFMPASGPDGIRPKQVETNLMAASLGYASQKVNAVLRSLYHASELSPRLGSQRGGSHLAQGLALAYQAFGQPGEVVLFIVPPGEVNAFDQRAMQMELVLEYSIPVVRTTLEEVGEQGAVRGGRLWLRGRAVAIAYLRAGYSPAHYQNPQAWEGRRLLECSETLSIPSCQTQLANTKKIQQVLSKREILEQFVSSQEAVRLQDTMVRLATVEEAREQAMAEPEAWVLKPCREGGGNNFFGEELKAMLQTLSPQAAQAYVLMETIRQRPFWGIRLVEGKVVEGECYTELGHFSYACWNSEQAPQFQATEGYLLRTKDFRNREGLVLGGYSYLDTCLS